MRLDNYLIESDEGVDPTTINEIIHKNCKKYLNLIHGKFPMYRGMSTYDHIGIKDVRKDRRSKGMADDVYDFLNKWLQKNGHNRRDQSVMCTSSESHVNMFGPSYWIFPLDPMSYSWVSTPDINITTRKYGWENITIDEWYKKFKGLPYDVTILNKLKMPFEHYFSTDAGFSEAYDKRFEMWIHCNKYYYVASYIYNWNKTKQSVNK